MDIVGFIIDLFEWIVFFVLLAVGFFVGRLLEKGHYESIRKREKLYAPVLAFSSRFPPDMRTPQDCRLVCGCVFISSHYYSKFVLGVRSFFVGGRGNGNHLVQTRIDGWRDTTNSPAFARRIGSFKDEEQGAVALRQA